ncbi:MAG TPA: hypothetical protein VMG11_06195 [Steroidobacteraceae bacterium]|nr:hypothetical protein [Steroidobacteraceae bacterium]
MLTCKRRSVTVLLMGVVGLAGALCGCRPGPEPTPPAHPPVKPADPRKAELQQETLEARQASAPCANQLSDCTVI